MHLALLLSLLPLAIASPATKRSEPAPLLVPRGTNLVANEYIVKFKKGSPLAVLEDALKLLPRKPNHIFESLFQGFSGKLDGVSVAALRAHPDVSTVSVNVSVYITC
jgi:hypothetical protein